MAMDRPDELEDRLEDIRSGEAEDKPDSLNADIPMNPEESERADQGREDPAGG